MHIIEGVLTAPDAKIAIVVARFNNFINESLLKGSLDTLRRVGNVKDSNISIIWVPGAYELPLIVNILASTGKYNAILALATIIRGNTEHFKLISNECSARLANIAIKFSLPISFGVLTTENIEQAIERAGTKMGNKGIESALTALEMINTLKKIKLTH